MLSMYPSVIIATSSCLSGLLGKGDIVCPFLYQLAGKLFINLIFPLALGLIPMVNFGRAAWYIHRFLVFLRFA